MSPLLLLTVLGLAAHLGAAQEASENVALGAPYTLTPAPNYGYCTDPGDTTQLTDGIYTEGYFWVQPSTVGWSGGGLRYIKLDLGQVVPISGLSFNTAAGVADVHWPAHILIFVSDDGLEWHQVGDLMRMVPRGLLPDYGTYAVRKLETHELQTHGRFVQLAIDPGRSSYSFVDEIEVYRGDDAWLDTPLPGEPLPDIPSHFTTLAFNNQIRSQLDADLAAVREDLQDQGIPPEQRAALLARADQLDREVGSFAPISPQGFRAVLPMTDLERDIFALQAAVWRAQGKPLLRIWQSHRWDPLSPSAEPLDGARSPLVEARMMNGEVRADVLNFTNAAPQTVKLTLRIEDVPQGPNPPYILVRRVMHVGTRRAGSVAAALPEADFDGEQYTLEVPPGMVGQAWFEFRPENLPPGRHEGQVVVGLDGQELARVPLRLVISPVPFPERTSLLLGGWDYTDGSGAYGVTPRNRLAFIEYLKDHRVNMPWATSAATPEGAYDEEGNLVTPPDTSRFDEWVQQWEGAELFMVFLARERTFAGAEMGSEQFRTRLGNWAHFWAQHMRNLGLKASQLGFLVYDEPSGPDGYRINEEWARAINAAEPELVMFVDPIPASPEGMDSMVDAMDVLCPNRIHWMSQGWLAPYYEEQRKKGKDLWFYSCSGPARSFDPVAYYLAQAWHVFAVGGKASCFWAFGDTNKADVWNEYTCEGPGPYCAMYLDDTSVTTAKWFEAIRESAQDFEYLTMLKARADELGQSGQRPDRVAQARELLQGAPQRLLDSLAGRGLDWNQDLDRGLADKIRYQLLDALEALLM